jgi:hypothetical protein
MKSPGGRQRPGVVGARIILSDKYSDGDMSGDHPGLNQILAAGAANEIPINVWCWRKLALLDRLSADSSLIPR